MSDPATPSQGKPDDEKVRQDAEDSKEAKGTEDLSKQKPDAKKTKKPAAKKDAEKPESKDDGTANAEETPTRKRTAAKLDTPQAEGTAAAETGVDKAAAEALASAEETAPKGKSKTRKAVEGKAKPKAEKQADGKKTGKEATKSTPKKSAAPASRRRGARESGERVIVRAQARYVRSSARKARLVCDAIRGKDVTQARAILAFHPRAVSEAWIKLLDSAVANAENNHDLDGEDLRIAAVYADEGPTIKRFRPRAMGRATRIRKRTSHLTIQLTPKES